MCKPSRVTMWTKELKKNTLQGVLSPYWPGRSLFEVWRLHYPQILSGPNTSVLLATIALSATKKIKEVKDLTYHVSPTLSAALTLCFLGDSIRQSVRVKAKCKVKCKIQLEFQMDNYTKLLGCFEISAEKLNWFTFLAASLYRVTQDRKQCDSFRFTALTFSAMVLNSVKSAKLILNQMLVQPPLLPWLTLWLTAVSAATPDRRSVVHLDFITELQPGRTLFFIAL